MYSNQNRPYFQNMNGGYIGHNPFYGSDPLASVFSQNLTRCATDPQLGPAVMFLLNVVTHKRAELMANGELFLAVCGAAFMLSAPYDGEEVRKALLHVAQRARSLFREDVPTQSAQIEDGTIIDV